MISLRVAPLLQKSLHKRGVSQVAEQIPARSLGERAPAPTKSATSLRWLSTSATEAPVNLYQYKICPFSNIAKTVLTYQQVPFHSVEVNPLTKAELKFSPDYRKVPIVTSSSEQWNGTEEILEHFAANSNDDDFATGELSVQWQDFARNKLAPLLYPNLCSTLSNSFRAFDYVHRADNEFTTMQKYSIQYAGSLAMYFAAGKIKKKYNLDDVRVALDEALLELESGLNDNASNGFLNGDSNAPHLGDLTVFGILKGLEGLAIFDEIFQDERYPSIRRWYAAMNDEVESKRIES